MRFRSCTVLAALAIVFVPDWTSAEVVTFQSIPGAASANDMSPDGRFIVGETDLNGDGWADGTYLLDRVTNQMTILPPEGLGATAVSDDGTVVLGDMPDPMDPDPVMGVVAGRWTEATRWQSLGYLPNALECPSRSDGYELSADGGVAVGLSWDGCSGRGFVWTASTGMLELQPLANGSNRASVVSADGTVIGGFAQGTQSRTPAVWNGLTRTGELLDPPSGNALGEVHGIRDDGTVLLGTWTLGNPPNAQAVTWTRSGDSWVRNVIGSGSLTPGWEGIPMDIADSGTIVGFDFLVGYRQAWIRPVGPGGTGQITSLRSYITAHGGTVPSNIALDVCQAISRDGRYIIGHGYMSGAWLVTIRPDPHPGDMNCDGRVDFDDIDPFVVALSGQAAYDAAYPDCNWINADCNADTAVNFDDIDAFVALIGS